MTSNLQIMRADTGGAEGLTAYDPVTQARVKEIINNGTADSTKRAWKGDLNYFISWASAANMPTDFPAQEDTIITFVANHFYGLEPDLDQFLVDIKAKAKIGPHSISTIERRVASISAFHRLKGYENPCTKDAVRKFMQKARKAAAAGGYKPVKKKAATRDILDRLLATCGGQGEGIRDRAILSFAFSSGGRRRSEVAGARIEALQQIPDGYIYDVGRSKTNQMGHSHLVPVIGSAGETLKAWLEFAGNTNGPIFRAFSPSGALQKSGITGQTVARIVKKHVKLAGLDPADFSGHSLRAGFMTESARRNINLFSVMEMSGHKSVETAKGYFQAGEAARNPAANI